MGIDFSYRTSDGTLLALVAPNALFEAVLEEGPNETFD
jgi:hypothetical protein